MRMMQMPLEIVIFARGYAMLDLECLLERGQLSKSFDSANLPRSNPKLFIFWKERLNESCK